MLTTTRVFAVFFALWAAVAGQAEESFRFPLIDGGQLAFDGLEGRPILVVNTASRCAFADQYDELQTVYDTYRDNGLVVLAVPSNEFRQELKDEAAVRAFCAMNFDLDIPITEITEIRGAEAHPFYAWVKETTGFVPRWNFNKILVGPDGTVLGTWRAPVKPTSKKITSVIEQALARG